MVRDYDMVYIVKMDSGRFNVTTSNYKGYGDPKAEPRATFKEALELLNAWYLQGMSKCYWESYSSTDKQVLDDVLAVQLLLTYG